MGRVSNHAKMEMDQANAVLGAAKQSKCCIMAVSDAEISAQAIGTTSYFYTCAIFYNLWSEVLLNKIQRCDASE